MSSGATLILGAGPRLTVAIARSLHARGIAVVAASIAAYEGRLRSRAIRRETALPDHRRAPGPFIDALESLIAQERIDLIMPTGDGAMAALGAHYERLAARVHLGCPPPAIMERVLDKSLTLAAAARVGVPIPASRVVTDPAEVMDIAGTLGFPLIAKPAERKGIASYKVRYFNDAATLEESVARDPGAWIGALVQEYCQGDGVGIGALIDQGEPVAMFQHRRLKEYPFTGGVSVMARAERVDEPLGEAAIALLREIGWQGIAMVEFRHDRTRNTFRLMEVNGRYWGSLATACRAGMDFPYYEWQLAHGQRPTVVADYAYGQRVRWVAGDLKRLHHLLDGSHGNGIVPVRKAYEIGRFFTDFNPAIRGAIWSWRDPLPALSEFAQVASGLIRADSKAAAVALLPAPLARPLAIYRRLGPSLRPHFLRAVFGRVLGRRRRTFRPEIAPETVLFLCHGNIYRSCAAAAFFERALPATLRTRIDVVSAGLWEGLARIAPRRSPKRARDEAQRRGISLEDHRSQPVTAVLAARADVIFVMDYHNEALLLAHHPEAGHKTYLLGGCITPVALAEAEIADPYDGDAAALASCYRRIEDQVTEVACRIAAVHPDAAAAPTLARMRAEMAEA